MKKLIKSSAPNAVLEACNVLNKENNCYPTDTLYGLGCDSKNEKSIKKLNKIKNRSGPISVIAPNRSTAIDWMFVKKIIKQQLKQTKKWKYCYCSNQK